jgi:hypothetical protein
MRCRRRWLSDIHRRCWQRDICRRRRSCSNTYKVMKKNPIIFWKPIIRLFWGVPDGSRGITHFRSYDATSCDVTFGHVTSGSHATFGHEQWYYYSKKKGEDALPGMRRTYFRPLILDQSGQELCRPWYIIHRLFIGSSPNAPLAHSRVSHTNFDIWKQIVEGGLYKYAIKICQRRQSSCPLLAKLTVFPGSLNDLSA